MNTASPVCGRRRDFFFSSSSAATTAFDSLVANMPVLRFCGNVRLVFDISENERIRNLRLGILHLLCLSLSLGSTWKRNNAHGERLINGNIGPVTTAYTILWRKFGDFSFLSYAVIRRFHCALHDMVDIISSNHQHQHFRPHQSAPIRKKTMPLSALS